jgi:hypothetical protein
MTANLSSASTAPQTSREALARRTTQPPSASVRRDPEAHAGPQAGEAPRSQRSFLAALLRSLSAFVA